MRRIQALGLNLIILLVGILVVGLCISVTSGCSAKPPGERQGAAGPEQMIKNLNGSRAVPARTIPVPSTVSAELRAGIGRRLSPVFPISGHDHSRISGRHCKCKPYRKTSPV